MVIITNLHELAAYPSWWCASRFSPPPSSLQAVTNLLHTLPNLLSLTVLESTLETPHGTALALSLPTLPLLRHIDLSHTGMGNSGLEAIKPGLEQCRELRHLGLANCRLGDEAVVYIEDILQACDKLEACQQIDPNPRMELYFTCIQLT